MSMNADEALKQGVVALRDWLAFLEEKRRDVTRQLERARRSEKTQSAPITPIEAEPAQKESDPPPVPPAQVELEDPWL